MSNREEQGFSDLPRHGWKIGPSIAIEIDVALSAVRDYRFGAQMPADFALLLKAIPEEWRKELPLILRQDRSFASILEIPAYLTGVLTEGDYSRATLAIRALTLEEAIERFAEEFRPFGVTPDVSLSPAQQLVELGVQGRMALFNSAGFEVNDQSGMVLQTRRDFERLTTFLNGRPQHDPFWHWLDRFYFQVYHDWRQSRAGSMAAHLEHARAALGSLASENQPPEISWLPALNPIQRFPTVKNLIQAGEMGVYFWVEPFGMADLWGGYPGRLFISFEEPGPLYDNFMASAQELAERTKALADPTRLIILRIIRHFGMVNTEIAAYLGLSRPTVSVHARILREAGLIRSEQVGREVRHEIVPSEVHRLFRDLEWLLDLPEEKDSH